MLSAATLHERGVEALEHGRLGAAGRHLNEALRRTDDTALTVRILGSLSYYEAERGRLPDGLQLLDDARALAGSRPLRALVASQRGLLLMRSGVLDGALAALTEALAGLTEVPSLARTALNRGDVYLQSRDLARAKADFSRCIDVCEQAVGHDHLGVLRAKAQHNLGYLELLHGDIPKSLRLMDAAREVLTDLSAVSAAIGDLDRATALWSGGLLADADAMLASAIEAFSQQGMQQGQAEAEVTRAELQLTTGRPAVANRLARRASVRFRRRGSESWALRADAVGLAAQVGTGHGLRQALRTGPPLAEALSAAGLRDEARTVRLYTARAAVLSGQESVAIQLLQSRSPATAPITTRLLERSVRADLAVHRCRHGDATRHLRAGLADLFAWQSSFGSLDLQTGVASHGRALAMRAVRLGVDDGRPHVVFDWTERARAFASRVPPLRPPDDSEGAAVLAELRQLRLESGPRPDSATRQRMSQLEHQVRDRALYSPGPGIVTEPLVLADLQALLGAEQGTLVSHLVVDGRLHAIVADGDHASVHRLGTLVQVSTVVDRVSRDLDAMATRLPHAIREAVAGSLHAGLLELGAMLWHPLVDAGGLRGGGPLLLVPSASLASVPWTLLRALAGRPVAVARTASSWAHNRRPAERALRVGLVTGPGVDRAREEVDRSANAWPRSRALGPSEATADAVSLLASGVDLLHVAAHGRHNADNPLFSALELTDGPWFGHDIVSVSPVPAHVVLSACELGRSSVRSGEETLGMTAAWQHAGARTVIASPVRVNDDTACEVLAAHHAAMAAGAPPATAMAGAMAALPPEAPPAPFVCFGAGW